MNHGKETCRILKELRHKIAEANDIALETSECRFKGDCTGTCPRCEAEVRYLERQLAARNRAGKAIRLAGIAAGALAMVAPVSTAAEEIEDKPIYFMGAISNSPSIPRLIKGNIRSFYTDDSGNREIEAVEGAVITNLKTKEETEANKNGFYTITAKKGDVLRISFIGYFTKEITVDDNTKPLDIILDYDKEGMILGEYLPIIPQTTKNYILIDVLASNGKKVNPQSIIFEEIVKDIDDEIDYDEIYPYMTDKGQCYICWSDLNGADEAEVDIRVTAEVDGHKISKTFKLQNPEDKTGEKVILNFK
ncbi:MAG: hypothetical protein ACI4AX_04000 [Muribaculaceae bacterium]